MHLSYLKNSTGAAILTALFSALLILTMPTFIQKILDRESEYQPVKVQGEGYPLLISDSLGHSTIIKKAPKRIISLTPSLTETLCKINATEDLLAVTSFCKKSNPQFKKVLEGKIEIVNGINPSAEQIAEMDPDLILTVSNSSPEFVSNIRKLGVPVIVFGNESLETVLGFIPVLGQITGHRSESLTLLETLTKRLTDIDTHVSHIPYTNRPSALIMFDLSGGGAGGESSFMGDILERAGGRNLAIETGSRWPTVSTEWMMEKDPSHIFLDDYREGDELGKAVLVLKEEVAKHPIFGKLSSVENDRLHIIGNNLIVIPGPRTVDAVEILHSLLYPDFVKNIPAQSPHEQSL